MACKQVKFKRSDGTRVSFKACGKGRRAKQPDRSGEIKPRRYITVYTGRPQQGARGDDGRTKRVWGVIQNGQSVMATDADPRRALAVYRQQDPYTSIDRIPVWDGDPGKWTTWGKVSKAKGGSRSGNRAKRKKTKYRYLFVLQADYGYGHGWEDEGASEDRKEIRDDLRAYRSNAPEYNYRIIQRRELRASGRRATIRSYLFDTYEGAKRYLRGRNERKLPGKATVLQTEDDGSISVVHHRTRVVTYHKNGSVTIRPFDSLTTRQRINHYVPGDIRVWRKDWYQYVGTSKGTFALHDGEPHKITKAGNVTYGGKRLRAEK